WRFKSSPAHCLGPSFGTALVVGLTPSGGVSTLLSNTRSTRPLARRPESGAHRTPAGDLDLSRRLRRPARLPADRARDRRGRRARLAVHRPRPPGQPRAGGAPPPRPDEAARSRADGPRGGRRGDASEAAA